MATQIDIEIKEDGKICLTTGSIEQSKHIDADALLEEILDMAGGDVDRKENPDNEAKRFFATRRVLRGGKIVEVK
jgi:hypothetical protein